MVCGVGIPDYLKPSERPPMQMIIEVKSTRAVSKLVKPSTKPGSKQFDPFEKHIQRGYVHAVDPISGDVTPQAIDIDVPGIDKGYPVGRYTLDTSSFFVNNFGTLVLGKLKLEPIAQAQRAAA